MTLVVSNDSAMTHPARLKFPGYLGVFYMASAIMEYKNSQE